MSTIKWTEKYSVGIEILDQDHQKLIDLVNQCIEALEGNNLLLIHDICRDLEKYTYYHFGREEDMMEQCGYPDLQAHKKKHQILCDTLNEGFMDALYDHSEVQTQELIKFLKTWLFDHILNEDKKYMSAMIGFV